MESPAMRIFSCPACTGDLFFENQRCGCGAVVSFDPEAARFERAFAPCANRAAIGCNWVAGPGGLCRSCAMTEVVPQADAPGNAALWARAEAAKRWVLAGLARWGWLRAADPGARPRFHLLSEAVRGGEAPVVMGHAAGLVTINVSEADPAEIARRRAEMGEPFRTMIGHFRHELAHYLFERLARDAGTVGSIRATFGDERADYAASLRRHYADGPPEGWARAHVTAYAAAHPFEDWAETVAHLLHLTDMADGAEAAGLSLRGAPAPGWDAYAETDAARLLHLAAGLGVAFNHASRSVGLNDPYPFVLNRAVRGKLAFVHGLLSAGPLKSECFVAS
jgi:hypothetical protein